MQFEYCQREGEQAVMTHKPYKETRHIKNSLFELTVIDLIRIYSRLNTKKIRSRTITTAREEQIMQDNERKDREREKR